MRFSPSKCFHIECATCFFFFFYFFFFLVFVKIVIKLICCKLTLYLYLYVVKRCNFFFSVLSILYLFFVRLFFFNIQYCKVLFSSIKKIKKKLKKKQQQSIQEQKKSVCLFRSKSQKHFQP